MECYCYLRNIQDLLCDGKTPQEWRFGIPFNGPVIPFGAMVEFITLFLLKTCRDCMNSVQKSCQEYSLDMSCMLEKSEKDTSWSQTLDGFEIHGKRLNTKEVSTSMRGEKFIFPSADGTVELSGGYQDLRTSTLIRDSPDRGEEQDNLLGESVELHSPTAASRLIMIYL